MMPDAASYTLIGLMFAAMLAASVLYAPRCDGAHPGLSIGDVMLISDCR